MGAREKSSAPSDTASEALDPDIRRFVSEMGVAWSRHGDVATMPFAEARRVAEEVRAPWAQGGPEMLSVKERMLPADGGPVCVRFYDPGPPQPKPVLIYLHGGGWTLFSLDTHDRVMREYAARAGVIVAGVDYALSPEAKYPVALKQVVSVARFVAEHGAELGIVQHAIGVGGDSAGANLALAASISLRDQGRAQIVRAIILNYGVFDRQSSAEAIRRFGGEGNMLTASEMESFWLNYLPEGVDAGDPLVSPLRAELKGLPPVFLTVPGNDLLSEQSVQLAGALRKASVPVRLEIYRGAAHSFLEAVSIAAIADRAFADGAAWLRENLRSR